MKRLLVSKARLVTMFQNIVEHSHGIFLAPQTIEIEVLDIEINLNVQFLDNFVMNASRNSFTQDVSNMSNTYT